MPVDTVLLAEVEPVLRELNLTNEAANKLAGVVAKVRAQEAKAADDALVQQGEDWVKQVRSDPDLGGAKFEATALSAQKAIAAFGTPELKELLNSTYLGNHPEVVRIFSRIGQALGEDKLNRQADAGGTGQLSLAERLYPSNPS
jgi:hypothetical protein